jgi:hypothetical protein
MGMVLREAVCRVKRQDANLTRNRDANGVHVGLLIGNLDEAISGDRGQLAHLPQNMLLVVVLSPHLIKQMWDDGVVLFRGTKLDALTEAEVRDVVRHGSDVVKIELGLTELSTVCPMVSEVPRPRRRITVQTWAVDLKLLIG